MSKRYVCRHCRRPILLVQLPVGGLLPVDPAPTFLGSVIRDDGTRGRVVTPAEREKLPPGTLLYASHYITCPSTPRDELSGKPLPRVGG